MNDPVDVIAKRFSTEIVGRTGDSNGGRLSGTTAMGLARLAVETLRLAGFAVIELPEDTAPFRVDEDGDIWDDDMNCVYTPLEAEITAARMHACATQSRELADADQARKP
ncbi:MAG: hypothetical protein PHQ28_00125 [Mycobacterium sp.]|nr:hypothetical protein [Mycobacterium sp.]